MFDSALTELFSEEDFVGLDYDSTYMLRSVIYFSVSLFRTKIRHHMYICSKNPKKRTAEKILFTCSVLILMF